MAEIVEAAFFHSCERVADACPLSQLAADHHQ